MTRLLQDPQFQLAGLTPDLSEMEIALLLDRVDRTFAHLFITDGSRSWPVSGTNAGWVHTQDINVGYYTSTAAASLLDIEGVLEAVFTSVPFDSLAVQDPILGGLIACLQGDCIFTRMACQGIHLILDDVWDSVNHCLRTCP